MQNEFSFLLERLNFSLANCKWIDGVFSLLTFQCCIILHTFYIRYYPHHCYWYVWNHKPSRNLSNPISHFILSYNIIMVNINLVNNNPTMDEIHLTLQQITYIPRKKNCLRSSQLLASKIQYHTGLQHWNLLPYNLNIIISMCSMLTDQSEGTEMNM